jgi:hypothetical protein
MTTRNGTGMGDVGVETAGTASGNFRDGPVYVQLAQAVDGVLDSGHAIRHNEANSVFGFQ